MKSKIKILLAEDSRTGAEFFVRVASMIDCDVDVASNGNKVIEMVKSNGYDIIFMDIEMPEMGGIEASKMISEMKAHGEIRDIPIIAFTAHDLQKTNLDLKGAGIVGIAGKPIHQNKLLEIMQNYLHGQKKEIVIEKFEHKKKLKENELIIDSTMAAEAKENFGERYHGALERFKKNGEARIEIILNEWTGARDLEKMAFEAHALISSSACLGAAALPRYSSELEKSIRAKIKGQDNDIEIEKLILDVAQFFDTTSKQLMSQS